MIAIELGKQLENGKTNYKEGVRTDFSDSGIELFIFYKYPTEEEINNINKGTFKFGYYVEKNIIFFLFKFGDQEWMDTPYSVHLSGNLTEIEEIKDGTGYVLNVFLVDANNGVVKVIRLLSLKNKISNMLRKEILKQKELSFDGFNKNLNEIYFKRTIREFVSMGNIMY